MAGARLEMAAVDRIGVVDGEELRQARAQPGPTLGDHDAVIRVAGLVTHRARESGTHFACLRPRQALR